jgi:riboflavin synthase
MFTGLAEGMGRDKAHSSHAGFYAQIGVSPLFEMGPNASWATVFRSAAHASPLVQMEGDAVYMDVSGETLSRTTLGLLKQGDLVNLERALRLTDRLGGHLVLGHVDDVGKILKKASRNNSWLLKIEVLETLSRYIIEKGSVAVDGISLTINACGNGFFEVNIIPHTGVQTTLLNKNVGEPVNIETDLIGKYVEKLLFTQTSQQKEGKPSGLTHETLLKYGFGK